LPEIFTLDEDEHSRPSFNILSFPSILLFLLQNDISNNLGITLLSKMHTLIFQTKYY